MFISVTFSKGKEMHKFSIIVNNEEVARTQYSFEKAEDKFQHFASPSSSGFNRSSLGETGLPHLNYLIRRCNFL